MKPQTIRHLIIGLLTTTGVFHLAVALLDTTPGLGWPLTIFGLIYIGLSFYVRRDVRAKTKRQRKKPAGRPAIIVTMIVTAGALGVGGARYVTEGGPMALPIMFLIDAVIIAAGAWWLAKTRAKA